MGKETPREAIWEELGWGTWGCWKKCQVYIMYPISNLVSIFSSFLFTSVYCVSQHVTLPSFCFSSFVLFLARILSQQTLLQTLMSALLKNRIKTAHPLYAVTSGELWDIPFTEGKSARCKPAIVGGRCFLTFDLELIPWEGVQINMCFPYKKNRSCIHLYIYLSTT